MDIRYTLERATQGWQVCENGEILAVRDSLDDALQIAELLTFAAKAAGRSATVVVEGASQT
jgi:hypothetical protein